MPVPWRRLMPATLLFCVVAGCGDNSLEPDNPFGRITIDPRPGSLIAPWTIAGPEGFAQEGGGVAALTDLVGGDYTLTWGDLPAWQAPGAMIQTLSAGGHLTFRGDYLADAGSVASFLTVEPGSFVMGSPLDEPGRFDWEEPHEVTLTQRFAMSMFEVTEAWWDAVMGTGAAQSRLPKHGVSWDLAVQFCNALSIQEGLTPVYDIGGPGGDVTWNRSADGYRLPTEAEWEYACRAGSMTAFPNGPLTGSIYCSPIDPNLDAMGWYCGNSDHLRQEVGQKQPNAWGLYDMHGNVSEWVWDGYRVDYENLSPTDPAYDATAGSYRIFRGGAWFYRARSCRSASRRSDVPEGVFSGVGLRPVRTLF